MSDPDRLYALLPAVYRARDADQGFPLQALLRVISEQVVLVESDIAQLYDNWFIETCEDWVVPYLGDLLGYRLVHEAGQPGGVRTAEGRALNRLLIPRREIAHTIAARRRKGTLALLDQLAHDVAGWPARVVEFYRLAAVTQPMDELRSSRGRTVDVRHPTPLDLLNGPFDRLAHTVDVRRIDSHRTVGRYNIPSVGLFVWRLRSYRVERTPAYCQDELGGHCYSFSALGNDTALFTQPEPEPEPEPERLAGELDLPVPIALQAFSHRVAGATQASQAYYGQGRSLSLWAPGWRRHGELIPPEQIVPADLKNWPSPSLPDQVLVDPTLGRIVFSPEHLPPQGVWVAYYYGFSADIGGGEYARPISQPADAKVYASKVGGLGDALKLWRTEQPRDAVIELTDSGVYSEQINIDLPPGHSLQIRAAQRARPIIRLLDWQTNLPDSLSVSAGAGSRFVLDGLLITGRSVTIKAPPHVKGAIASATEPHVCDVHVIIRHCTLVPGWGLHCDCGPHRPAEPSLELYDLSARVDIEHSITGAIEIQQDEVRSGPVKLHVSDSLLDATEPQRKALSAPGLIAAHAILTILRSTVFGEIETHAIALAENCIFAGLLRVARRQVGCIRFCYVTPCSRTPRRYECQPDLAARAEVKRLGPTATPEQVARGVTREERRVEPRFTSVRYGTPAYGQLSQDGPVEIARGADDESEMGVYHDLFNPQRAANLRARLAEFTPAGMDAGIIYST